MEAIILLVLSYAFPGLVKLIKKAVDSDDIKLDSKSIKENVLKVKTKIEPKYQNRVTRMNEKFHFKNKNHNLGAGKKAEDKVYPTADEILAQMESEAAVSNNNIFAEELPTYENEPKIIFVDELSKGNHNFGKLVRNDLKSRQNIKKAVIMSEILGKPKSLSK